MFKKIFIMIICLSLFLFISNSSFGLTLVAEETFQDYSKTLNDNVDVYDSMLDESQSDSNPETSAVIIGRSINYKEIVLLLYDISETNYINTLELNITEVVGVPYNMNFLYNIYICRSTTSTLTNNNDIFYDCVSDLELVAENWNMSYWLGSTTGTKTIYLEQQYYLEIGKHYNIIFEYVSGNNTINQYYRNSFDTNPSLNYYKTVVGNSSSSVSSAIIDFRLYYSRDNIYQLRGESDYLWDCYDNADYPDCKECLGSGNCNSGLGNNLGYFNIGQTDSNRYLNLFTNKVVSGGSGGFEGLDLKYLVNDSFDFSNINDFSIQYDVRLNDVLFSQVQSSATEQLLTWGGILSLNLGNVQSMTGHFQTTNETQYKKLRNDFISSLSSGKPTNTDCDISDGEWHRVTHHYYITDDASKNINYTLTFVDNDLCNNYTSNQNVGSGISPLYFRFMSRGIFDIDFDNFRFFYDGFVLPSTADDIEITHLICPVANCLFYDHFDYTNDDDLADYDYTGLGVESVFFNDDSIVYFNSSDFTKLPVIEHDIADNDYNRVISLFHFRTKPIITPIELEDRAIAYKVSAICKDTDTPLYTYNVYLSRDDDFTYSENRTVVNLYSVENAKQKLLGTFTTFNGEYFDIKVTYDLPNQRANLNIFLERDVEDGFFPDNIFSVPMNFECSSISGVEFGRRDIYFTEVDDFSGIDLFFFSGIAEDLTSDEIDFIYTNKTTQNDSIVKSEIGEILHNSAFSLGFKTPEAKLGFWFLIMFFFIYMLFQSNAPQPAKLYGGIGAFLFLFVIGFYFKFINIVLFTFIMFVVALIGALIYMKLFSSSGTGG